MRHWDETVFYPRIMLKSEDDDSDGSEASAEGIESDPSPALSPRAASQDSICVKCKRPIRAANAAQCPNVVCAAWFHQGCLSVTSAGKCMICHRTIAPLARKQCPVVLQPLGNNKFSPLCVAGNVPLHQGVLPQG